MRRSVNIVLILVVILLLMILIGSLVIPIPPLQGTLALERLADSDSQFIKLKNVNVHHKQTSEGQIGAVTPAWIWCQHVFIA